MSVSPREKFRRQAKRARLESARRVLMTGLRMAGASCANCSHFKPFPVSGDKRHVCMLDSGGGEYMLTTADDLCPHHPMAKELVKP